MSGLIKIGALVVIVIFLLIIITGFKKEKEELIGMGISFLLVPFLTFVGDSVFWECFKSVLKEREDLSISVRVMSLSFIFCIFLIMTCKDILIREYLCTPSPKFLIFLEKLSYRLFLSFFLLLFYVFLGSFSGIRGRIDSIAIEYFFRDMFIAFCLNFICLSILYYSLKFFYVPKHKKWNERGKIFRRVFFIIICWDLLVFYFFLNEMNFNGYDNFIEAFTDVIPIMFSLCFGIPVLFTTLVFLYQHYIK